MFHEQLHMTSPSSKTNDRGVPSGKTLGKQSAKPSEGHQPIIGIPMPIQQGTQGPLLLADAVGAWAIERMGGRVFLIPLWPFPTHKHMYQSLWSLVQSMDGLLLPASVQGTNWYAHWIQRESHPGPQTWTITWEVALAQMVAFIGMPILAIADGAEKWNVALGGTGKVPPVDLAQKELTPPDTWSRCTIRVRSHSQLVSYIQPALEKQEGEPKPWELAFMPCQEIETVAQGLRPCAQTDDASLVAFERSDAAFGLGIIGRLDWGLDQAYGMALFEAFLQACSAFDDARQQDSAWQASRDTICAALYDHMISSQPLLSVPQFHPQKRQQDIVSRSGHDSMIHAVPTSPSSPSGIARLQECSHQRSHQPTKEELNTIRRQRLKLASK